MLRVGVRVRGVVERVGSEEAKMWSASSLLVSTKWNLGEGEESSWSRRQLTGRAASSMLGVRGVKERVGHRTGGGGGGEESTLTD